MKVALLSLCAILIAACGSQDVTVGTPSNSSNRNGPSDPGSNGPGLEGPNTGNPGNNATTPPAAACPAGQVMTWRYTQQADADAGFSGISTGDRIVEGPGGPPMTATCEAHTECTSDQVAVIVPSVDYSDPFAFKEASTVTCTSGPPVCASGTSPEYIAPVQVYEDTGVSDGMMQTAGTWRCSGPCDLIVNYGAMFNLRKVCTSKPNLQCTGDTVATFIVETETWSCQAACEGGKYDPATYEGANVCIPC
jgi:hypothetical protein